MNFEDWILKQRNRKDDIGSLAINFVYDPRALPGTNSRVVWRDWLVDGSASPEKLIIFEAAFKEWLLADEEEQ